MLRSLCFALLAIASALPLSAQRAWNEIVYPPLGEIPSPEVRRVELDNGLILYLVEDHELPLISLSARIGVGSVFEPAEKAGLASITGTVMRSGGTTSRTGDEIDLALESIGASVETGIGETSGAASMSVLKGDLALGLEILADVLMSPAFPEDKIELAKVSERSDISRRNDDPQSIGFREFEKLIYGADSPWARQTEYATIDAIGRDDLVAFHRTYFVPNNTMIGVWGDFDTEAMVEAIRNAFADWKPDPEFKRPTVPEIQYTFRPTVNLVEKTDVNQSVIVMGHLGGRLDNPDFFALEMMNTILGGGFSSRLLQRVRSDQGLAYDVFGMYGASYDHPGIFYSGVFTKSESTVQAIRSVSREIEGMQTEPVTDEELSLAKDAFLNSFVFNFDSKGEVINRLMTYEYYGYPEDFLQRTKQGVEAVTKEDVLRVANAYLQPDKLQLVVVGRSEDFDEPLSVLGPVNEIDVTIPEPGAGVPEATGESLETGRTKLDAAIEATGGKEAYGKIRSMRMALSQTVQEMGGNAIDVVMTVVLPDRIALQIATPMGEVKQTLSDGEAVMTMGPQSGPAPAPVRGQLEGNLWRNMTMLFAQVDAVQAQDLGSVEVEGERFEAVRISPPVGPPFTLYLERDTMLPVMQGSSEGGVETLVRFSDFRPVDGIQVSFKTSIAVGGNEVSTADVKSVEFNVEPEAGLFE